MKDTTWNGKQQSMTRPDGVQKGMKTVQEERSMDISGMNAEKMRQQLLQEMCKINSYLQWKIHMLYNKLFFTPQN